MDKLQTVYLNCPGSQSMMGFFKLKYLTKVSFVGAFHVKPSDTDCSSQENSLCRYTHTTLHTIHYTIIGLYNTSMCNCVCIHRNMHSIGLDMWIYTIIKVYRYTQG